MPTRWIMPFENLRSCSRRSRADTHAIKKRRHPLPAVDARKAEKPREIREELFGREVVVEVRVLGKVADALPRRDVANRPAQDLGTARRRENQLHQQLERRRLTGAVGTEEAEDLARLDLERQAVEGAVGPFAPEAD